MTYNVHKVIPISDINPARNTPVISRVFMISTVLVFILIQPKNQIELINFFYQYSAIPCELVNFAPLSESQFYNNSCFYDQFKVIFPNKNLYLSVIFAISCVLLLSFDLLPGKIMLGFSIVPLRFTLCNFNSL